MNNNNYPEVLSPECIEFLKDLHQSFEGERNALLEARVQRQQAIDAGQFPDFRAETQILREQEWQAAPIPQAIQDRRVEITGPVDRKMIINALNSDAKVFMADFEDSNAPSWSNCLEGQKNLIDAVQGVMHFQDAATGKEYQLNNNPGVLMVRPRGLHLVEGHFTVEQSPIAASLFDAGIYLFHNAAKLNQTQGIYLYIPKLQAYEEAQFWEDVLTKIETELNLAHGSIKVTVLIETIHAVFEMNEIIHALQKRIVGLNCGRWDYIFSYIKTFRASENHILPDRNQVTMTCPFLQAYVDLLVYTCHRRGIHAMGGMAAQIPIKNAPDANEVAMQKVRADKLREVKAGHDGTWVAHPGLIPIAQEIFDAHMPTANQIAKQMPEPKMQAAQLLAAPEGIVTVESVRNNISVSLHYMRHWLAGQGCVPINYLMEDAATAEICRTQLWQWLHCHVPLENGNALDREYMSRCIVEEVAAIQAGMTTEEEVKCLKQAQRILEKMTFTMDVIGFLTLEAYPILNLNSGSDK